MGQLEQAVGLARVQREPFRRPVQGKADPTEDQEVEVQFARAPALAVLTPERTLKALQRDEEPKGAGLGIQPRRHIQGDDGVPEVRLVHNTDRLRHVQARDPPEPYARQRGEGTDAGGEGRRRIAEIRPEPHVRADLTHGACQIPSPR